MPGVPLSFGQTGARAFCPVEHRRWVHRGAKLVRQLPVLSGYAHLTDTAAFPFASHSRQRKRRLRSMISVVGGSRNPCRNELGGISSSCPHAAHWDADEIVRPQILNAGGV
jgi:hypothetical protein